MIKVRGSACAVRHGLRAGQDWDSPVDEIFWKNENFTKNMVIRFMLPVHIFRCHGWDGLQQNNCENLDQI